jgi:hypothetical protein
VFFILQSIDVYTFCAVCLDGSPPAYHFDKGFEGGIDNWIVHFEVCQFGVWSKDRIPDMPSIRSVWAKDASLLTFTIRDYYVTH